MKSSEINIDDFLCFSLYSTSRYMTQLYKKHLKNMDLTYPQFLVLLTLWNNKKHTVHSIGEELHLETGTLTPLIKRLENKKLLKKTRSSSDERVINISLTAKGKKMKENFPNIAEGMLCDIGMNMSEVSKLSNQVNRVRKNIISSLGTR